MNTKEIIEIINTYGTDEQIQDINKDFQFFADNIRRVRNDMINQLQNMYLDEDLENDTTIINENIVSINKYLKSIKEVQSTLKCKIEQEEIHKPIIPEFDSKIHIHLVDDDLCPECNVKLHPSPINYQIIIQNTIHSRLIKWYKCPVCKKLFVLDCDIENFNFEKTNIILDEKYHQSVPPVSIYSVVVLSNTLKCSSKCHTTDVVAKLPTFDKDGKLAYVSVHASYCFNCKEFTILKDDFSRIKNVVICKITDKTSEYNSKQKDDIDIAQRNSVLFNYGYNVQTKADLSEVQRHRILASVIEAGIMTRRGILDHLTTLIQRGNKIPSWRLATDKWLNDKKYISNYRSDMLPEYIFDNIILRYKEPNK